MQALRHQASSSSSINLLSSLLTSFSLYNTDPTPNAFKFIIKTLIQTSQSHHLPPILHHLQKSEKFETPESILIDLIEFYGKNNNFQEAIDVFFKMPNFRCVPTIDSLNCLLSILCKRREGLEIVPVVLLKSRLMNIRLEESSFEILIEALCRFGSPRNAIDLLYHMVDYEIEIDRRSFSLVLSSLCEQKGMECKEVMGLVEEMKKLGFCLGKTDWGNLIRFLVRRGKGMEALEGLNKMKSDGFEPDVICYTMVLDAVICEGGYETADQVFDEMLVVGLVPDINTYNVYINGLCKQSKFDDGIEMLSSMVEIGCKPNMITYNTILSAIYESGELGKASEVLKEVRAKGVLLHSRTYQKMIYRMMVTDDVSGALGLLEEMVRKNLVSQPSTFDEIVCRLSENGLVSKALNLMTKMLEKDVIPGCRSWEALIVGFHVKCGFNEIDSNVITSADLGLMHVTT